MRTIIHCLNGINDRQKVIDVVNKLQLDYEIYPKNPYAICINGDTSENLIGQFSNDKNFVIFTDKTPQLKMSLSPPKKLFHPHFTINQQQQSSDNVDHIYHVIHKEIKHQNRYLKHNHNHLYKKIKHIPSYYESIPQTPKKYGNTTSLLSHYYNFPAQNGTAPTIGIISLGGTYLTTDIEYYWKNILKLSTIPSISYVDVDGVTNAPNQPIVEGDGSIENTLDIEIAGGMCHTCKIVVYFGPNTELGFYDVINYATNDTTNNPSILSISWGSPESNFSNPEMSAYNDLFGLTTQIVCVASGDNGSTDGVNDGIPHTDFPSSSPYVISCGGTSIHTNPESTWSWNNQYQWGTGGGISSMFSEPMYQLSIGVKYPTGFVPHRAVPDVSMNADPLCGWTIYFDGTLYVNRIGGTSCVAPALSGLFGLMNLINTGKGVIADGFLNRLYGAYSKQKLCFKDITKGTNDNVQYTKGMFDTKKGYDFCTGLGSVNGKILFNYIK